MSKFNWPEPSFEFVASTRAPEDVADSLYFVCHDRKVLLVFDEEQLWRPLHGQRDAELLGSFEHSESHFMGMLGQFGCYALEVASDAGQKFVDLRGILSDISSVNLNLAGLALQLGDWQSSHRYCGKCGIEMVPHETDRAMVCNPCRLHFYPRLSPSIIVLVYRGEEVLLARNHLFPEGLFSTLAGFVEPGESIEQTVHREVKEEVGVNLGKITYRGSQPWPFPNSLMLGFHAEYESGDLVLQEDEIADAQWFHCSELPTVPGKFAISRWLIDDYISSHGYPV